MMTEAKKIAENVFIAFGNVVSWMYALFTDSAVAGLKDILAIVVSLLTIILLAYKIQEARNKETDE